MTRKISSSLCVIALCFLSVVAAGPFYAACVAGCTGLCTAGAPPAFAACMAFCIGGCATSCFSNETLVTTNDYQVVPMVDCQPGQWIKSFEDVNSDEWTKVINVDVVRGNFSFVRLFFGSSRSIEVTPSHGMFVVTDRGALIVPARELAVGDILLTGPADSFKGEPINSIQMITKDSLIKLTTASGAVVANGVSVSTLCDEEVSKARGIPISDALADWRSRHQDIAI